MSWQTIFAKPSPNPQRMPVDPFFALSLDLLCITTLDGRLRRANPAFLATLGHPEPNLLAANILDFVHPADLPAATEAIAGLARGIPIAGLETRFRSAGGDYKPLAWNCTPFLATRLAYIVARDTARREVEARCGSALDPGWHPVRIDRPAGRLWMCDRDHVLTRNFWELFPEAAGGPFHRMYEQVVSTGTPAQLEEFHPAPFDRWFQVRAYPSAEGLAVYFRDVTAHRLAEEETKRALQEKEVLLREVHHRVKNNLQVICSMLRLQARNFQDPTLLQALKECRERVMAMAMLHDQLHRAKDFSNINLGEYIRNLAASLFSSYGVNSADIGLRLDVEDISVAVDTAIPCGLIVNELVSNSLRHAFPDGSQGTISLDLHARPGGWVELALADDGRGFADAAHTAHPRSLGLWLVELLASQIGAAVERSSSPGTRYRFQFQNAGQASLPDH